MYMYVHVPYITHVLYICNTYHTLLKGVYMYVMYNMYNMYITFVVCCLALFVVSQLFNHVRVNVHAWVNLVHVYCTCV